MALNVFWGVGCFEVEYFFKNDATKEKEGGCHRVSLDGFAAELPGLLGDAERGGVSLVVRVAGDGLPAEGLLQLDDCDAAAAALLEPFSFATFETSEKNYQCWLAFRDDQDKAAVRDRLFAGLRKLAPGVNPGSGGALRWPGSINFKPERDGWRVRIHSTNPGRTVTPAELDDAGLLADQPPARNCVDRPPNYSLSQTWPDYEKCLRTKPTRSEADAQFVWIALQRGFAEAEIAAKLSEISERAQKSGEKYVARTLSNVRAWDRGGP